MNYLVIGGTGSLGRALLSRLVQNPHAHVSSFSRDELKVSQLRKEFPTVRGLLGDVRDPMAVLAACKDMDVVFHVAALKHVDILETQPFEAISTNVLGTVNVYQACEACDVSALAFASTDKAVLPINAYGMTKALAEKYLSEKRHDSPVAISLFRWGNVVGSRGSAIPYFIECIKTARPIPLTHLDMTRFWIGLDAAARFMLERHCLTSPDVHIPPMKAASVVRVIDTLGRLLDMPVSYDVVGVRRGEKIHECLTSTHAYCLRSDTAEQYTDQELEGLLEKCTCTNRDSGTFHEHPPAE